MDFLKNNTYANVDGKLSADTSLVMTFSTGPCLTKILAP